MIAIPISRFYNLKKMCTITVLAIVSKNEIVLSDEGNKLYYPIYNFTFNSKNYEITKNVYTNIEKYPKGTIVQLRINPNNPNEFLDNSTISKFIIILGILFLIVSLPVLCYSIVYIIMKEL